jgi:hypothetical protein
MVTQVMVETKRRPIAVGRHELVFHTCARIEAMPTRWHESADGRFKVSTPELTALDSIQRASALGGMSRVREVLRALWPHCEPEGLAQALDAMQSVPVAQRLGGLLTLDEQTDLLAPVSDWLRARPMRLIALEGKLDLARLAVQNRSRPWSAAGAPPMAATAAARRMSLPVVVPP